MRSVILLVFFSVALSSCTATRDTVEVTTRPVKPAEPADEQAAPDQPIVAVTIPSDGVRNFDGGKMWTFDNPPLKYFQEEYGFTPDESWFERARLGALRFSTYCSASFVSPNGLVLTNHHCARQSITDVTKDGENLMDNGFYADSLTGERRVDELYVDQLVSISDVTEQVYSVVDLDTPDFDQHAARNAKATQLSESLNKEAKASDSTLVVEVIALFNGARYSAYTFRRYDDVRLVMAPELKLGYFGGDPDNFTYPRYSLDMSFFRVYDEAGAPLQSDSHFRWSTTGANEGDAVFVIGNPGSTSRLSTVSQLEFERDYSIPAQLDVMTSRATALNEYIQAFPDSAESYDLRNPYFSISNSIKAMTGQLRGLTEGDVIAKRESTERLLEQAVQADSSLIEKYGTLFRDIAEIQQSKKAVANQTSAFTNFSSESMTSHVLLRGLYGFIHDLYKQRGAPPDVTKDLREEASSVKSWPRQIEKEFIRLRLEEMRRHLGAEHPGVAAILGSRTAAEVAEEISRETALADSMAFQKMLDEGYQSSGDVSVDVVKNITTLFFNLGQQLSRFDETEQGLSAKLAQAQFEVFGESMPPDASFSLRISDGRVQGYSYNGTSASAFTTFYGLYDRANSHRGRDEWQLPQRWQEPLTSFELSTPINLVSTNDITGGNSGSPLLNQNLELVGLVFDSNIDALPNEYVYTDNRARAISVDARGILESLDDVYDADRIRIELTDGTLFETENDADKSEQN